MGVWNASLYAWMYGQVILDMYIPLSPIIPLLHECCFRYSPNQETPCLCSSLYTLENAPLVKRLQSALWMIFNNRKM